LEEELNHILLEDFETQSESKIKKLL